MKFRLIGAAALSLMLAGPAMVAVAAMECTATCITSSMVVTDCPRKTRSDLATAMLSHYHSGWEVCMGTATTRASRMLTTIWGLHIGIGEDCEPASALPRQTLHVRCRRDVVRRGRLGWAAFSFPKNYPGTSIFFPVVSQFEIWKEIRAFVASVCLLSGVIQTSHFKGVRTVFNFK